MSSADQLPGAPRLRTAIVLRADEDVCIVFTAGRQAVVGYAPAFPGPHAERVAPGHLVAFAGPVDGSAVVIWRWFDAVVLGGEADGQVRLWEPAHGQVLAQARDPGTPRWPGSRAYLSSGLPGAQWWVAGAAVARAEDADVELEQVQRFYTAHGLWDGLS